MGPSDRLDEPASVSRLLTLALAGLALVSGCALFPLSEADCRPQSWRQRGYDDGFSGALSQEMRLVPECRRRFGVEVPVREYLQGWDAGHDEWYRIMGSTAMEN